MEGMGEKFQAKDMFQNKIFCTLPHTVKRLAIEELFYPPFKFVGKHPCQLSQAGAFDEFDEFDEYTG